VVIVSTLKGPGFHVCVIKAIHTETRFAEQFSMPATLTRNIDQNLLSRAVPNPPQDEVNFLLVILLAAI